MRWTLAMIGYPDDYSQAVSEFEEIRAYMDEYRDELQRVGLWAELWDMRCELMDGIQEQESKWLD